jgi:hypothetical protein
LTGLTTLRAALAVIAASLLGGCSNTIIGVLGSDARTPPRPSHQAAAAPGPTGREVRQQLASLALDDHKLSGIRGGFDIGSGVTLNFAFQQSTFVNGNLAQTIVVPTMTVAPGAGSNAVSAATAVQPSVSVGALNALGLGGSTSGGGSGGINSATVVANGMVQTQVAVSNATLQAMVNAGLATVVGGASNSGISSTIVNGANNQLIQQMTTVDIGISGLSKLLQQNVTSSLVNRLNGPNTFR